MSGAFPNTKQPESQSRRSYAPTSQATTLNERYSMTSNEIETGESSRAGSRLSSTTDTTRVDSSQGTRSGGGSGRGSTTRRSRRNGNSGGFLLSDPGLFDPPAAEPANDTVRRRDVKGKGVTRPEDTHGPQRVRKQGSKSGLAAGSSLQQQAPDPDRISRSAGAEMGGDSTQDTKPGIHKGLDADSAKIVNLALNLSESRRQAGRRIVSSPLPPQAPTFEDGFQGGSLRQHLQAQRRISRSPRPERGSKHFNTAPREAQLGAVRVAVASPLEAAFDVDGNYQYTFSQATLDRAEKARNAIELMAQYRRLLHYLPPLKPASISRTTTLNSAPGTSAGSPTNPTFNISRSTTAASTQKGLGREYNPLQYIRNRKVRARERQPIDGGVEGFADVPAVTAWIDRIAATAETGAFESADVVQLPPLHPEENPMSPPNIGSPELTTVKTNVVGSRPKNRPMVDWLINAPDLLADADWLERDENKKLIEDKWERKLFPQRGQLVRMHSHDTEELLRKEREKEEAKERRGSALKLDTKLPIFRPVKKAVRGTSGDRAKKIKKKFLPGNRASSPAPDKTISMGYHSESGTSGNELPSLFNKPKRARAGTADSHDMGRDVLEKQLTDMLWREKSNIEKGHTPERPEVRRILSAMETHSPMHYDSGSDTGPSRENMAPRRKSEFVGGSSKRITGTGRESLEVPGHRPRLSIGTGSEWDTTAPNSPDLKANNNKLLGGFVPSMNMDMSSPPSRKHSPTRKPALQRVKSKISRLRDRSAEPSPAPTPKDSRKTTEDDLEHVEKAAASPASPPNARSPSPTPKIQRHRKQLTVDSVDSPTVGALVFGGPLPKSRNPLARVGDLLFGRERRGSTSSTSSSTSSSSSDSKEDDTAIKDDDDASPPLDGTTDSPRPPRRSFLGDMPTFRSPFQPRDPDARGRERGRSPHSRAQSRSPEKGDLLAERERKRKERLQIPRIDVQRASGETSPVEEPRDRSAPDRLERYSSIVSGSTQLTDSDFGSTDLSRIRSADARLNAVLGIHATDNFSQSLPPVLQGIGLNHNTWGCTHGNPSMMSMDSSSPAFTQLTKKELARIRLQLLRSGLKAREFTRKAVALRVVEADEVHRVDVEHLDQRRREIGKINNAGTGHKRTAQLLAEELTMSHDLWVQKSSTFLTTTVPEMNKTLSSLKQQLSSSMAGALKSSDEADDLNRTIMAVEIQRVKALGEAVTTMMRKRRRRFRWARRGGWVLVEWALVGVMWWVWLVVVLLRVGRGCMRGVARGVRWLVWF